uniref:Uncharacterized mitochondrial protein AtMg00810-like n=1 Tax=Nicotiana tabacum TaxID=4097 RepID=A0A1S4A869_TOBAC|nr:PREDICTED: uncharacterized mitochondrial protein AtMg00810-like [Nicotiana tabacum]
MPGVARYKACSRPGFARLPTPILHGLSPFEKFFYRLPDYNFLRVFGCECFPNLSARVFHKLTPRSVRCVFLDYASDYKGYHCLDPKSGHLDVKNTFLHGVLTEEVYMKQPTGFIHPHYPNHVCKLTKDIYGLKQAPRAWFHRFSAFLISHGFACSKSDSLIFIYCSSSHFLILLLYIDDIILTDNHSGLLDQFISRLSHQFAMKDLGNLHCFLSIQAVPTSHGLHLSQQKHIVDLLLKFHMHTCKPLRTPLASRTSISLMDGELLSDPSEHRSMAGALQYLTMTRLDIAYAVNVVSQFMHAPCTTYMHCVKRIFRYLQGTLTYGLTLRALSMTSMVIAYSDVDWAGCPDSHRSTTSFAVFLGTNFISWRAKKQPAVSKLSKEAEYRAIAYTVAETC